MAPVISPEGLGDCLCGCVQHIVGRIPLRVGVVSAFESSESSGWLSSARIWYLLHSLLWRQGMWEYSGHDQSCHVDSESLNTAAKTPSPSQASLTKHIWWIVFLCIFCCLSIALNIKTCHFLAVLCDGYRIPILLYLSLKTKQVKLILQAVLSWTFCVTCLSL